MPKITGLGAGIAPANNDVLVLVANTAGTANTQKVTVNTFFSNVTSNSKFANLEATILKGITANLTTVDINGGAMDGVTIGAASAAPATFTVTTGTVVKGTTSIQTPLIEFTDGDDAITIADGGGVTVPNLTATTADINGGTMDGTVIGGASAAAITATTITGTVVKGTTSLQTPLIEFTDGDDAITIADGGGVTIPNLTATTADINGGTIDGTVIGGSSAVAITGAAITGTVVKGTTSVQTPLIEFTDGDDAIQILDGGDVTFNNDVIVTGNLTIQGTQTTVDSATISAVDRIIFEGSSADDFETTLLITNPTGADKTITMPNLTGTVSLITAAETLTNKTLTSPDINTPDIDGGTMDSTVIGGTGQAAITGTTITGTVVKGTTSLQTPLIEFTDGDDAIVIADGGGVTIADATLTTADINGGTLDNVTIGGAAQAAITATTITGTVVKGTTSLQTPLIEFTDGDDAIVIANGGGVTIADATLTTADINGGTVDAANITVGSGKTLDVSGGTLTLADNQISGNKVEGGTIAGVTVTSLASTTVDTTNIEVTNIKALDGTAAATIAQSTGVITVPSAVLTTADINGGTVDGAVIGGTTAAAITGVAITGTIVKGTTSVRTPLIEFTDGDDAIVIADGGGVTIAAATLTTADINGGTIDATNVTVGSGKTLDVSAGTLTLAADQISGDKVQGGTIASVTVTALASTTVDTTNIEVTNIKALDGTAAGSIAQSTGVVTLASSVLTTADINGGTVDGAIIGGASAAAITGTTIGGTIISGSTSVRTPLIEFTDGDDAIVIADGGGVTIADATLTTADINGGTVDAANITVGSGKTLDVSAGTLTLAADQISGDKVQGGTIASTTITSLAATTVDTTNIEVTNVKALDGTAAATIAQSTGVITVPSSVLTTTDINGGTVDGAVIGGASAAAITGTAVVATNLSSATVAHTIEALTADGALDLTKTVHTLDASSATCQTTLANGTIAGQIKYIIAKNVAAATDVDLTTSLGAGGTYTFQAVGECIQVLWTGAAWAVISVSANPTGTNVLGTIDVA